MTINNLDNTFSVIKICHTDIENQISGYALEFLDIHNHNIEWHMRLPMFVPPFYDYVKTHNAIPNQYDYYKHYCQQNKNELISKDLTKEQVRGLRARVYRTYPSLVRDIHFGLFLISENAFEDVFYNEILDIEYGIDLVVKNNAENIGLCLFTKTKNAQYARKIKEFRPKKTVDFKCLEIPMDFKGSVSCGEFFLYGTREKNIIIETLNSTGK